LVVTNQRGVGKGLMTEDELITIHEKMCKGINEESGRIDKIYFCTDKLDSSKFRKPNVGMALQAKKDFPEINFTKSIMIGDSISDMLFGDNLGMTCFYIGEEIPLEGSGIIDARFKSLYDCASCLIDEI
jgi:D-glycero-D-manno-heptose 1,7-bisphosphate phosphatase